jgi:hypothetical protein
MEPTHIARPRFWIRGLVPGILIGIGLLHSFVGVSGGRNVLVEIARDGFWDTVHSSSGPLTRPLLIWFLVSGFVLILLGHLALWVDDIKPLPSMFGVELLAFAVVSYCQREDSRMVVCRSVCILLVARAARKGSSEAGEAA